MRGSHLHTTRTTGSIGTSTNPDIFGPADPGRLELELESIEGIYVEVEAVRE